MGGLTRKKLGAWDFHLILPWKMGILYSGSSVPAWCIGRKARTLTSMIDFLLWMTLVWISVLHHWSWCVVHFGIFLGYSTMLPCSARVPHVSTRDIPNRHGYPILLSKWVCPAVRDVDSKSSIDHHFHSLSSFKWPENWAGCIVYSIEMYSVYFGTWGKSEKANLSYKCWLLRSGSSSTWPILDTLQKFKLSTWSVCTNIYVYIIYSNPEIERIEYKHVNNILSTPGWPYSIQLVPKGKNCTINIKSVIYIYIPYDIPSLLRNP